MYAFEPWSGSYTVNAPIWTSAHTCQFTQPGWSMLLVQGGGSGTLAGGGSYVTYVAPDGNFTVVVEKLQGACLRCAGETAVAEELTLTLAGGLERFRRLQLWSTNDSSEFVRWPDVQLSANNQVKLAVQPDNIYTLSSWYNGQSKGSVTIPPSAPFALPYADNFDSYASDGLARFFADDGGSFQVANSPDNNVTRGRVYKQWVPVEAGVNGWGQDTDPVSYIGNPEWTDVKLQVDVWLEPSLPPPQPPAPPGPSQWLFFRSAANGQCLDVLGQSVAAGTVIDTYACVQQDNERFSYNAATGHIVGKEVR